MAAKPFVRKDRFYLKAKKEGYPARSAYKIMELDERFKIFKAKSVIVDLGCAPGGWLKVAQEKLGDKGLLIGIDLLPLQFLPHPSTCFLQGDFTVASNQQQILDKIPHGANWILSDMSPNISGIAFRDHFQSYELCQKALEFARLALKKGGSFLCKTFPGKETDELRKELRQNFAKVVTVIPEATRQSSTEVYLVGLSFTLDSAVAKSRFTATIDPQIKLVAAK